MIGAVIGLGVLALGLVVWLVVVAGRLRTARARIVELEAQTVEAELAAASAAERADKEAARAVEADGRAKAADAQATEAQHRATEAEQRTEVAEEKVAEAIDRADQSEERALAEAERRASAQAELAAALEIRLFDADGMWALGRRRMERLWRDRLRLLPDEASPLDGSDGDPEAAVRLMAEASREESGVVVDVTWSVDEVLSPARAALLVLLAEELIAVARESDGGELDVSATATGVDVALKADPGTGSDAVDELRSAVESFGWSLTADDTAVAVHVPTSDRSDTISSDDDGSDDAGSGDSDSGDEAVADTRV